MREGSAKPLLLAHEKRIKLKTKDKNLILILITMCAALGLFAARADALFLTPPDTTPSDGSAETFVITKFDAWHPYTYAIAVEAGALTPEEIAAQLDATNTALTGYDESGKARKIFLKWDAAEVDTSKAGVYQTQGAPLLEDGCTLAASVFAPRAVIPVSVQEKGKPQLNVFHTAVAMAYTFPWVAPPCDPEEMTVWLSEDGGEWRELAHDDDVFLSDAGITFFNFILKDGSSYKVQADYTGGRTNVFSFSFDKDITDYNFSGGDRDGGDVSAPQEPNVEQPAGGDEPAADVTENDGAAAEDTATNDESNGTSTEKPSAPLESSYAGAAVYSGKRIDFMREKAGGVRLSRSTFELKIPEETLDKLALKKDDTLLLAVTRGEGGLVSIVVEKNGRPADDAGPLVITLPAAKEADEKMTLLDAGGAKMTPAGSGENGESSFIVAGPGTYRLTRENGAPAEKREETDGHRPGTDVAAATLLSAAAYLLHRKFMI